MKKMFKLLGIIALAAVIGFAVTACKVDGGTCSCTWKWEETTPATEDTEGLKTEVCSKCGAKSGRTEPIPILENGGDPECEHNFPVDWSEINPATCTESGSEENKCIVCEEPAEGSPRVIEKLEHDFNQWEETTAPTCTTAGEETEKCSKCSVLGTNKQPGAVMTGHFFNNHKCAELCFDFGMVLVEKGTFTMGPDIWNNQATVDVEFTKDFRMSKYQVTQELYLAVMGTNPSYFLTGAEDGEIQGRRPVEQVNWYHAIAFCNRLSILEGLTPVYAIGSISNTDANAWLHTEVPTSNNATWNAVTADWAVNGYRLPTDAQWEYAARAGTSTKWHFGDDESKLEEYAWYGWDDTWTIPANANGKTHQVGLLKPNQWGLYDMHGNVWEWCWDRYGNYPSEPVTDYVGAASGDGRVLRGGWWGDSAELARSVSRDHYDPGGGNGSIGFRLLRP